MAPNRDIVKSKFVPPQVEHRLIESQDSFLRDSGRRRRFLDAGGMGEVYRARDTTLRLKSLPAHLSSDPDLHARFEQEAKSIRRCNIPISVWFLTSDSQDGIDFIVMEYVDLTSSRQHSCG
jgi:serine/threonine protein kinase